VVDLQANRDFQRSGVGHATLFALGLVILQLQTDGVAALGTEVRGVLVVSSAKVTKHVTGMERVGDDHMAAVRAGGTQMVQTLEVAAFALPVADGIIDKLQLRHVAKISDREN